MASSNYQQAYSEVEQQQREIEEARRRIQQTRSIPERIRQREAMKASPRFRQQVIQQRLAKEEALSTIGKTGASLEEQLAAIKKYEKEGYKIEKTDEGYKFIKEIRKQVKRKVVPTRTTYQGKSFSQYQNQINQAKKRLTALGMIRDRYRKLGLNTVGLDSRISKLSKHISNLKRSQQRVPRKKWETAFETTYTSKQIPALQRLESTLADVLISTQPPTEEYVTKTYLKRSGLTPQAYKKVGQVTLPEYTDATGHVDKSRTFTYGKDSYSDIVKTIMERQRRVITSQHFEKPSTLDKNVWDTEMERFHRGDITFPELQEKIFNFTATIPDRYSLLPEKMVKTVLYNYAIGNITETQAQESLERELRKKLQQSPEAVWKKWGYENVLLESPTQFDKEGKPILIPFLEAQKREPALRLAMDKEGVVGVTMDYLAAQREEMERLGERDYSLGPLGTITGKGAQVAKGTLDVLTQFPLFFTTGAGYVYRSVAGIKQPSFEQQLRESVMRGSYGISQAARQFHETGDWHSYVSKTVGLESPFTSHILLPALTGGAIRFASPYLSGVGTSISSKVVGARTAAAVSKLSRMGAKLGTKGRKLLVYGTGTAPITAPIGITAYQEAIGEAEPGATAEQIGGAGISLLSFGAGAKSVSDYLSRQPGRHRRTPSYIKRADPRYTVSREAILYGKGAKLGEKLLELKSRIEHANRFWRGKLVFEKGGVPGTQYHYSRLTEVSPFGKQKVIAENVVRPTKGDVPIEARKYEGQVIKSKTPTTQASLEQYGIVDRPVTTEGIYVNEIPTPKQLEYSRKLVGSGIEKTPDYYSGAKQLTFDAGKEYKSYSTVKKWLADRGVKQHWGFKSVPVEDVLRPGSEEYIKRYLLHRKPIVSALKRQTAQSALDVKFVGKPKSYIGRYLVTEIDEYGMPVMRDILAESKQLARGVQMHPALPEESFMRFDRLATPTRQGQISILRKDVVSKQIRPEWQGVYDVPQSGEIHSHWTSRLPKRRGFELSYGAGYVPQYIVDPKRAQIQLPDIGHRWDLNVKQALLQSQLQQHELGRKSLQELRQQLGLIKVPELGQPQVQEQAQQEDFVLRTTAELRKPEHDYDFKIRKGAIIPTFGLEDKDKKKVTERVSRAPTKIGYKKRFYKVKGFEITKRPTFFDIGGKSY